MGVVMASFLPHMAQGSTSPRSLMTPKRAYPWGALSAELESRALTKESAKFCQDLALALRRCTVMGKQTGTT